MEKYELTLVLDPDLKSEDQKKLVEKIKKMIEEAKGKIDKQEDWGKKELAYPINKKKMGFYFYQEISLPSESLTTVDKKIKIEERILRFLFVRKEQ